ncbi:hypothetical protein KCP73_07865 [Salmonella enterica subsp. enterica]|nr:hypothetical protein KCP73_07865 [Salmonella enterica subsp. enterica]
MSESLHLTRNSPITGSTLDRPKESEYRCDAKTSFAAEFEAFLISVTIGITRSSTGGGGSGAGT